MRNATKSGGWSSSKHVDVGGRHAAQDVPPAGRAEAGPVACIPSFADDDLLAHGLARAVRSMSDFGADAGGVVPRHGKPHRSRDVGATQHPGDSMSLFRTVKSTSWTAASGDAPAPVGPPVNGSTALALTSSPIPDSPPPPFTKRRYWESGVTPPPARAAALPHLPPDVVARRSGASLLGAPTATEDAAVSHWLAAASQSMRDVSPELAAESIFRHVQSVTSHEPPGGSAVRLAVASLLLEQRLATELTLPSHRTSWGGSGGSTSLLATLFHELLLSVYGGTETGGGATLLVAAALHRLGIEPMTGIEKYLARRPLFEVNAQLQHQVVQMQQRVEHMRSSMGQRTTVVVHCAEKWAGSFAAIVFRTWKGLAIASQLRIRGMTNLLYRVQRRDMLLTHFYAWRCAAVVSDAERAQRRLMDGVDHIVEREAITNVQVVEFADKLDELKLTVARLKTEKMAHSHAEIQLKDLAERSNARSLAWRELTKASLALVADIGAKLTQSSPIATQVALQDTSELAASVLLPWAKSVVLTLVPTKPEGKKSQQPQLSPDAQAAAAAASASTKRLENFGSHLKDMTVFLLLTHVITGGQLDLALLQNPEPARRAAVIMEALQSSGDYRFPFRAEDLASGSTDINFLFLYFLWCKAYVPCRQRTPGASLKSDGGASFKEEADAAKADLEEHREQYPQWIEQRATLWEYAAFILSCKAKGQTVRVAVSEDEKRLEKDAQIFTLKRSQGLPEVFLEFQYLTVPQKVSNEEERDRVNATVMRHAKLLRDAFVFYAGKAAPLKAKGGNTKSGGASTGAAKVTEVALGEDLDFVGFYRLCSDCGLVHDGKTRQLQQAANVSGGGKNALRTSGDLNSSSDIPTPAIAEPTLLTKGEVFKIFASVNNRPLNAPAPAAAAAAGAGGAAKGVVQTRFNPLEFVAALILVAVRRYGPKVATKASTSAMPASKWLEALLACDIARGFVGASTANQTSFERELFAPGVQGALQRRRRWLVPFFEHFAGLDGDGTMQLGELEEAMAAIDLGTTVSNALVHQTFADVTGTTLEAVGDAAVISVGQADDDDGEAPSDDGGDEDPTEAEPEPSLVYGEFEKLLAALSVFKSASPFVSLDVKINTFMDPIMPRVTTFVKRLEKLAAGS